MSFLVQINKKLNKFASFNFFIQKNFFKFRQIYDTFRFFACDSTEIVQYNPLTIDNWVEKCAYYSRNSLVKHIKPEIGIWIRNDLNTLLKLDFCQKKIALVQLCKHFSNWDCCDFKTCLLLRSEIDKMSLNPTENDGLFHVYLHGARGLKERKRNVRLCKMVLNKLYKHKITDNFDQFIDYLAVIGLYYKPDSPTTKKIEMMLIKLLQVFHQYDAAKLAIACSRLKLDGEKIAPILYKKMIDSQTLSRNNRVSRALVKWRIATKWPKWPTD